MTAPILTIHDAPLPQTVAIAREALGAVLLWQPRRWVEDVPQPPEYRIPQGDEDGAA